MNKRRALECYQSIRTSQVCSSMDNLGRRENTERSNVELNALTCCHGAAFTVRARKFVSTIAIVGGTIVETATSVSTGLGITVDVC
jgi:hypothetical protein